MTSTEGPGTNTSHGHVWIRPDGAKARCGGPAICSECAKDAARWGSDLMSTQDEERFLNKPRSLDDVPTDALIAELGRRGYAAYEDDSYNVAPLERMDHRAIADYLRDEAGYIVEERTQPDQSERNTAPEEKWLEIWSHLNPPETDVYGKLARLNWAVRMLVELLEPPSVRERRLNGE